MTRRTRTKFRCFGKYSTYTGDLLIGGDITFQENN